MPPVEGPTPADTQLSSGPLAVGSLVLDGRFRVVSLLGGGGMGLVYKAEQVSLARLVAIKVLRDDLSAQPGMVERFRREALVLSSVESPHVVRIIEFGVHQGAMCLVMELVEGDSLETALRSGPLTVNRALPLLEQLARGLAVIHAKGIVHRDLKPENVLLSPEPTGEMARLLDFGIARFADEQAPGNQVTQAGLVLGTPEYLSPEQALGHKPEPSSDLYSFGVVAYRALTGKLPYPGPTAGELIAQHVHTAPTPILEAAPAMKAHPALAALVMQCLSKQREKRPSSALALAELVAGIRAGSAPTSPSTSEALRRLTHEMKAARPSRWKFWAAGVAVVVVGLLVAGWKIATPERRARWLLERGRGSEALQTIDDAGDAAAEPTLMQLRAAALHQVNRHEEELELFAKVAREGRLERLAVQQLAEDFGRSGSLAVRKAVVAWPKGAVLPVLQQLANEPIDKASWGALRLVDLEWAGQGLDLVKRYAAALESPDCKVRALSARRLGELPAARALEALRKLRDVPKKKTGLFSDDECGQDAAAATVRKLEKELPPE